MELIAKVSKGTLMDQIYLPKQRASLPTGSYVLVQPLQSNFLRKHSKPILNNIRQIEPVKLEIIDKILLILKSNCDYDNIIITGSFLEEGFNFNDIDILIITSNKVNKTINNLIKKYLGLTAHVLILSNQELIQGLQTDPLYQAMLSRCISEKKMIYKIKNKPNYKVLDLHLMKSKLFVENFDILTGKEKYTLLRNIIAIKFFIENRKISNELIDEEILSRFKLKDINKIKNNLADKSLFAGKFKQLYNFLSSKILNNVKDDKQE